MYRFRLAIFILLCAFALSLPGCVTGPGFGKADEPDRPQIKHPTATETKPDKKSEPSEEPSAPPPPTKPPAIGGSGG